MEVSHLVGGIERMVFSYAFVFSDPIAITTFVTMVVAILTGVLGRYLLFLVPRSKAGNQLKLNEVTARIQSLNESIERKFGNRRDGYTAIIRLESIVEHVPEQLKQGSREQVPSAGGESLVVRKLEAEDRPRSRR